MAMAKLDEAMSAAARDAILLMMQATDLWTEDASIAALPTSRCVYPRSWRGTELSGRNLGESWKTVCHRIEIHAWL